MSGRPTRPLTVQLPGELIDRLTAAAEERVIGRSLLIEHLLSQGLDDLVPMGELRRRRSQPTGWAPSQRPTDEAPW